MKKFLPAFVLLFLISCSSKGTQMSAYDYTKYINDNFPHRISMSEDLKNMEHYLQKTLEDSQYNVTLQEGTYTLDGESEARTFNNVIASKSENPLEKETIVIGAHYDSRNLDTYGASDNGSGVAALLEIAQSLKDKDYFYNIVYVLFGDEETGLHGSQTFVENLSQNEKDNIIAMINLDTVAGGDYIYVHSPKSTGQNPAYNTSSEIRDGIYQIALKNKKTFHLAPSVEAENTLEGETGDYSDYVPFYQSGIAIAAIETTNYELSSAHGYDGYSQSSNLELWFPKEEYTGTGTIIEGGPTGKETITDQETYPRDMEANYGEIWHTKFDRMQTLETLFPGRMEEQLKEVTSTVLLYLDSLKNN